MASTLGNAEAVEREATICGPIKERFYFWMWSMNAPSHDPARVSPFWVTGLWWAWYFNINNTLVIEL